MPKTKANGTPRTGIKDPAWPLKGCRACRVQSVRARGGGLGFRVQGPWKQSSGDTSTHSGKKQNKGIRRRLESWQWFGCKTTILGFFRV